MIINIASYPNVNKLLNSVENIDISIHENSLRYILKIPDRKILMQIKSASDSLKRKIFYILCKNEVDYIVDRSEQIIRQNSHLQFMHPKYMVIKSTLEHAFNSPKADWKLNVKDVTVERDNADTVSVYGSLYLTETIEDMSDTVPFNIYAINGKDVDIASQIERLKMMLIDVSNYNMEERSPFEH